MNDKPSATNTAHFSTETFPEIIAFCERDNSTRIFSGEEESYQYKLKGKTIYMVKKRGGKWEIIEFDEEKPIKISTGKNLGMVLIHALTFTTLGSKQEVRTNIIFPVKKEDKEQALVTMYYLGGYPGNFLEETPEMTIIKEKFLEPGVDFLAYSYVPTIYIPWLREELKNAGILGQDPRHTIWVYRK